MLMILLFIIIIAIGISFLLERGRVWIFWECGFAGEVIAWEDDAILKEQLHK